MKSRNVGQARLCPPCARGQGLAEGTTRKDNDYMVFSRTTRLEGFQELVLKSFSQCTLGDFAPHWFSSMARTSAPVHSLAANY
jgi:hypothetical protein